MIYQVKNLIIVIIVLTIFRSGVFAKNSFSEGNKLYLNGKYDAALKEYFEFINKNNDYYEGYYNAGNAYFRMGDYQKALDMYKKAFELNNKDEDVLHNIKVTEEKLKKQQDQSQCNSKNQNEKKQNNQQNQQGQTNKQDQYGQQNQQQQAQKNNSQQQNKNQQQSSGMTDDEVQALLNMKKKQEQQLRQYFGNQYRKKNRENDFPDFFNMTPDEIMRYMEQRMMNPFSEPKRNRGESGDKKDW